MVHRTQLSFHKYPCCKVFYTHLANATQILMQMPFSYANATFFMHLAQIIITFIIPNWSLDHQVGILESPLSICLSVHLSISPYHVVSWKLFSEIHSYLVSVWPGPGNDTCLFEIKKYVYIWPIWGVFVFENI